MKNQVAKSPRVRPSLMGFFVSVALLLFCGAGCSRSDSPNLEIRLWDHREAIEDFSELRLSISMVAVHPEGEPRSGGWLQLESSVRELDLTRYLDGAQAVILQANIPPGSYDGIRLVLEGATGILKSGEQVQVPAITDPVAIDFSVENGRNTILGLDLVVMDLSDHPEGKYELQIREAVILKSP